MLKAILVVDESGAKGYSKNKENTPNDFGVMAGYLIREENLEEARLCASKFFSSFNNKSGKLHLTDLTAEMQEEVRVLIYQIFEVNKICWFYEAIYVQGFHESVHTEERGGFDEKELLHSKLFSGVFMKAISRLIHEEYKQLTLHVITDRIDKPIIEKFKSEVKNYVEILTKKPIKRIITEYNKEKNEVEKWSFETSISLENEDVFFDSIQYDIECEDSAITFIADVLANTTFYYLKKQIQENPRTNLNSWQAIENHPLSNQVYGTYDDKNQEHINYPDIVYRRNKYK